MWCSVRPKKQIMQDRLKQSRIKMSSIFSSYSAFYIQVIFFIKKKSYSHVIYDIYCLHTYSNHFRFSIIYSFIATFLFFYPHFTIYDEIICVLLSKTYPPVSIQVEKKCTSNQSKSSIEKSSMPNIFVAWLTLFIGEHKR